MRLTSEFFVSAYLRRAALEGAFAVLRKRGAAEAGTIFVVIDDLAGSLALYGPAPQTSYDEKNRNERIFMRLLAGNSADIRAAIETHLEKEQRFDADCWIVESEDKQGRSFLELG